MERSKPYGRQFKVAQWDQISQVPVQNHNQEACLEELEMLLEVLEVYLALEMELLPNQQEEYLVEEQQEADYWVRVQELDLDLPLKEHKEEDCSLD